MLADELGGGTPREDPEERMHGADQGAQLARLGVPARAAKGPLALPPAWIRLGGAQLDAGLRVLVVEHDLLAQQRRGLRAPEHP